MRTSISTNNIPGTGQSLDYFSRDFFSMALAVKRLAHNLLSADFNAQWGDTDVFLAFVRSKSLIGGHECTSPEISKEGERGLEREYRLARVAAFMLLCWSCTHMLYQNECALGV